MDSYMPRLDVPPAIGDTLVRYDSASLIPERLQVVRTWGACRDGVCMNFVVESEADHTFEIWTYSFNGDPLSPYEPSE